MGREDEMGIGNQNDGFVRLIPAQPRLGVWIYGGEHRIEGYPIPALKFTRGALLAMSCFRPMGEGRMEYHVSVSRPHKAPTDAQVERVRRDFGLPDDARIVPGDVDPRVVHLFSEVPADCLPRKPKG